MKRVERARRLFSTAVWNIRGTTRTSYIICAIVDPVANEDPNSDRYYERLEPCFGCKCCGILPCCSTTSPPRIPATATYHTMSNVQYKSRTIFGQKYYLTDV